jgi:acyl-[acyl-carrier-protein]-phospholipid O-acyltransferase/long-chain-fatty-acid--[acyl-carrier-protein] ligase
MVSLTAVENAIARLWPQQHHAVVAIPDARKGEQLVLVTERADASREAIAAHGRELGLPELFLPRQVVVVKSLPLLGSGKADYGAVKELALAGIAQRPEPALVGASSHAGAPHP